MSRALVLGSGGVTGLAWMLGVLSVRPSERFDTVIGTSAGAFVGAVRADADALARACAQAAAPDRSAARAELIAGARNSLPRALAVAGPVGDALVAAWTMGAVIHRFASTARAGRGARGAAWRGLRNQLRGESLDAEDVRGIALLSTGQRASTVPSWVASWERRLDGLAWPDGLRIVALDAAAGARHAFVRGEAPLAAAVAASTAIPGLIGGVRIGEGSYFDAGAADTTSADFAAGSTEVVVLAPSPRHPLDDRVRDLRSAGAVVTLVQPSDLAVLGDGQRRLDVGREPAAFALGVRDGERGF